MGDSTAYQEAKAAGTAILVAALAAASTVLTAVETKTLDELPTLEQAAVTTLLEFVPLWARLPVEGMIDAAMRSGNPALTDVIKKAVGIAIVRIEAILNVTPRANVAPPQTVPAQ